VKLWITGANGQVGSALVKQAMESGHEVVATTRREVDITDAALVSSFAEKYLFEVIINAAAYTAVDKAETDSEQAFQVNAEAVNNLAQAALNLDIPLLHISTDYVFDGTKQNPYLETDSVCPVNVYGASKRKGEEYLELSGVKYINLRTSWVFGTEGNNFVKTMVRLANERDEIGVIDDQYGAPTFAADIANTLLKITNKVVDPGFSEWGSYHYSGMPNTTWWGFAKYAIEHAYECGVVKNLPKLKKITTEQYPTPAKRPANSRLDNEKIQKLFSVECSDWKVGVSLLNSQINIVDNYHV
jgi:dTDP-4-dehydrorhamnose reductase